MVPLSFYLLMRFTRAVPRTSGAALALCLALGAGCASEPEREPLELPPVASLRAAAGVLVDRVEVDDEPPEWLERSRVDEGVLYGIGIQKGAGDPEEDLYLAMHGARRAIIVWLEARGAGTAGPGSLLPPLRVDPEHVGFERLAYDEEAGRWYALARLDVEQEAEAIRTAVAALESELANAQARLGQPGVERDDRVRAALSIVYGIDRRRQYDTLYHALTGESLEPPTGLDDATLQERADDVLARHGMRVVLEGGRSPGLYDTVRAVLGEVHIPTDEFGRGIVSVLLVESDGFGPNDPYLEIDGHVELAIDGGDARTWSAPFRVVSTGDSLEQARFRASRAVNEEVARIVRETLRTIGGAGG